MAFAWLVECKTCLQRFAVKPREVGTGKSIEQLTSELDAGSFECPHCHEVNDYTPVEYIPGEGRIHSS